ncbi:hypothetical protein EUX98_g6046 [Antrodiella citrinella]|uniref:Cytochrome P450 n=1 Tax=Antrodiella citrinella TaxID=2447956 RepID=A0A4S4MRV3_9APHY|nr:hypothetical protein EUX98_g6046 [Antrodiella citrinella]
MPKDFHEHTFAEWGQQHGDVVLHTTYWKNAERIIQADHVFLPYESYAYAAHFHRFASAIILEVIYGHSVTTDDDEFMLRAREAVTAAAHAGSPGSTLVDVFPLLKHYPTWLPGSNFKVSGNHIRRIRDIMVDLPYNMVKSQMELGNYPTSFTASLLETYALDGSLTLEDEEYIKGSAATFLGGMMNASSGTDTVSSAMTTFILAMVRHPHVFKKAQEEIDSVVNSNRLPQLDDRNSLPYLDCIIKEVYRGISREAERYPEPSAFNPERYMNGTEDLDPKTYIFGFGRRICPGQYYADSSIFLVAANILATMNISMAKDEAGIAIIPPLEFVSGISTYVCSPSVRIRTLTSWQ